MMCDSGNECQTLQRDGSGGGVGGYYVGRRRQLSYHSGNECRALQRDGSGSGIGGYYVGRRRQLSYHVLKNAELPTQNWGFTSSTQRLKERELIVFRTKFRLANALADSGEDLIILIKLKK